MNGQKPEALRLAEYLFESAQFHPQLSEDEQGGYASEFDMVLDEAAAELRRLHEAHDWQYKMAGDRLRRIEQLEKVNAELLEAIKAALSDDQPYIERCKAALVKATGENNG